jgi:hypothetical protein
VLLLVLSVGCSGQFLASERKTPVMSHSIDFVQSRFPELKGIVSTRYVYENTTPYSLIGPANIRFLGIIKLEDSEIKKIFDDYRDEWEQANISVPSIFDVDCSEFLYCDAFDSAIHSDSFVGYFYLCTRAIYSILRENIR